MHYLVNWTILYQKWDEFLTTCRILFFFCCVFSLICGFLPVEAVCFLFCFIYLFQSHFNCSGKQLKKCPILPGTQLTGYISTPTQHAGTLSKSHTVWLTTLPRRAGNAFPLGERRQIHLLHCTSLSLLVKAPVCRKYTSVCHSEAKTKTVLTFNYYSSECRDKLVWVRPCSTDRIITQHQL